MTSGRWIFKTLPFLLLAAIACNGPARGEELTAEQVRRSIDRGVAYLKKAQNRDPDSPGFGSWGEYVGYPGGMTSLCTLALLTAGVDPADPVIQDALAYSRKIGNPDKVYSTAMQTMVFAAADPARDRMLLRRNAAWLEQAQIKTDDGNGGWSYDLSGGTPDNSNSQFALLGLYEAQRAGVKVDQAVWGRALNYWQQQQQPDGSWNYRPGTPNTGSMTCAGIASLVIASGSFSKGDASVESGVVQCCGVQQGDDAIQRGLQWLGDHYSVERNPSSYDERNNTLNKIWLFYYLYGVERVGRLTGQRFIGNADWYRQGAASLIAKQDPFTGAWTGVGPIEGNPKMGTAFALLFLAKGRRPVLVAKLQHLPGDDWNHHRSDLAHLTGYVETLWHRDMTWQVVNMQAATVDDLLQTPVLFISGRNALELTAEQKQNLRSYVEQGGFLFAEAACDGKEFDQSFRALMKELFPDSPLELLPKEHPVWWAEQNVNPKYLRPLYGLNACCRTSVVYCPENLSCYWELYNPTRMPDYPQEVKDEIAACNAIGANVLAYATNRQLRDKLDMPQLAEDDESQRPLGRGVLQVAKLRHDGGGDDAPASLLNLLRALEEQSQMQVSIRRYYLPPTDESLQDFPVVFMQGRSAFHFSPQERQAIAEYIESGGVLMADAICAAKPFADSFRREMQTIFPDAPLDRIPPEHPMFTPEFRGFDIRQVTLRDPRLQSEEDRRLDAREVHTAPLLEGIEIDGRYAVIFSPYDLSCALENQASLQCKGYTRQDAARIGINILLYALQQ